MSFVIVAVQLAWKLSALLQSDILDFSEDEELFELEELTLEDLNVLVRAQQQLTTKLTKVKKLTPKLDLSFKDFYYTIENLQLPTIPPDA